MSRLIGYVGIIAIYLVATIACQDVSPPKPTKIAFYHWKTIVTQDSLSQIFLDRLDVQDLYVRFFDVDWDGGVAVPISELEVKQPWHQSLNIIPTIFITNRTLEQLSRTEMSTLGERIFKKIKTIQSKFQFNISEIQMDCDWTASTGMAYFELLRGLHRRCRNENLTLSATIRLHQIKYFKSTGVPPVDRGMLMYYNMGRLADSTEVNSILQLETARAYHQNFDRYPLPLDVALPLFRWGVVLRDGKLLKLINGLSEADLEDHTRFHKVGEKQYTLRKSTYLQGHYLYAGDRIRLENVEIELLQQAVLELAPQLQQPPERIVFYHLDSTMLKPYRYEDLFTVGHLFR